METETARQRRLQRERTTKPSPTVAIRDFQRTHSPITADLARRLRFVRGLALPIDAKYESPRLQSIAVLQSALLAELQRLDEELLTIV